MLSINYLQHNDSHKGPSVKKTCSVTVLSETNRSCFSLVITGCQDWFLISADWPVTPPETVVGSDGAGEGRFHHLHLQPWINNSQQKFCWCCWYPECHLVGLVSLTRAFLMFHPKSCVRSQKRTIRHQAWNWFWVKIPRLLTAPWSCSDQLQAFRSGASQWNSVLWAAAVAVG